MTIAEVSRKYDLSQDTLRYYERIGRIPPVHRNASGFRDYTEQDCNRVEFIRCMRSAGLPIESLIEYMRLYMDGDHTMEARKAILVEERDTLAGRIAEMQNTLDRLNRKIENYESLILEREKHMLG